MHKLRVYLPGEFIGPYEVVEQLGSGGMGAVYKAKAGMAGMLVAVKVCKFAGAELTAEERERFTARLEREFATLREIRHPHVVRVYWSGTHEGLPYYAMELLEGIPFPLFVRESRLAMRIIMDAFAQVTGAVAFLHGRGLCHRDLKPSNVFIRESGEAVLLDFGLCKAAWCPPLTGPDDVVGTLPYASPEYARHLLRPRRRRGNEPPFPFSSADDVYGLGVMLYEVLTGRLPFRTNPKRFHALLTEIRDATPPHPCTLNPRAPRSLGDLAMRLLAKDPARRPVDGRAVQALLLPALVAGQAHLFAPPPNPDHGPVPSPTTRSSAHSAAPCPPADSTGSSERRAAPEPSVTHDRTSRRVRYALAALLVLLLVAGGLLLGRAPPPARPLAQARSFPLEAPSAHLAPSWPPAPLMCGGQVEKGSVPLQPETILTNPQPVPPPPTPKRTRGQARKAAVTAGVCFALSGCAGVPVVPDLLRECSPAGFAATKQLGLHPRAEWRVRVTNPVRKGVGVDVIREGLIEMETTEAAHGDVPMEVRMSRTCLEEPPFTWTEYCHGPVIVPLWSKLRGRAKLVGERVHIVLTELQLPGRPAAPFCGFVLGLDGKPGLEKNDPKWLRELEIDQLAPGTAVILNTLIPLQRVVDPRQPDA